jgi:protein-tyrosine phosphatase
MIPTSILFVCFGNICRSPMAEGVFLKILAREGSSGQFEIDSAGLLDYHQGELPDNRMRTHALARGYTLTHRSRPVIKADFDRFDRIIGMDEQNISRLKLLTSNPLHIGKIQLISRFFQHNTASNVPDPYLGDDQDFEKVIDLLEDACEGLYAEVRNEK